MRDFSLRRFYILLRERHSAPSARILLGMAYSEDRRKIFREEGELVGRSEIALFGRSQAVISGHTGVSSLDEGEIVVRLATGTVRLLGTGLNVQRVSPSEIYVEGRISRVEYPPEEERGGMTSR